MLKTKAVFMRKPDTFETQDCVIEKTIHLSEQDYDRYLGKMGQQGFIRDNASLMRNDREGIFHCLLVVGKNRSDGILIQSEGYDYARYAAFLPNAADFLSTHPEENPEEKSEQGIKLKDLMRIPLRDIHLVHIDEEIELATIVELKADTLTDEGRTEWADVLNADVQGIFEGIYGLQLECSGVSPQRLSDFSFMLAGDCPNQDYQKWVCQEPENGLNIKL